MLENFRQNYFIPPFKFKSYAELSKDEATEVWVCRNSPIVRQWMANTDDIPLESHLNYIRNLKTSDKAFYWAVYKDHDFLGGVSLVNLENNCGNSGIFLNPDLIGNGLGIQISISTFELYFNEFGLDYIYSTVNKNNINAVKMNKFLGCAFEEGTNEFYSIKLTNETWQQRRTKLLPLVTL